MTSTVRLAAITIENIKNVFHGSVRLVNPKQPQPGSFLALYGQNGSGKTALINAISILKQFLVGASLPEDLCGYIASGREVARLAFEFLIQPDDDSVGPTTVLYEFKIKSGASGNPDPFSGMPSPAGSTSTSVYDEKLSATLPTTGGSTRLTVLMDCSAGAPFVPEAKCRQLLGLNKNGRNELVGFKAVALAQRRSFIFSYRLDQELQKNIKSHESKDDGALDLGFCNHVQTVISRLRLYAQRELFVIDTAQAGLISLNALPLLMKYEGTSDHPSFNGAVMLNLNGPSKLPVALLDTIDIVINRLNLVLAQIIPGLQIKLRRLNTEFDEQSQEIATVDLVSLKNEKPISLRYESEGIKKIISVLHLLICVYNQRRITVAIDELDSGIFEYLLGELLRIISERGKGQLIFTSHNLRALETMDKRFICFTTTDPENRYTRVTNLKSTNNLRDTYFRNLILSKKSEIFYNQTNNAEIAMAMREAGRMHDQS